MSAAASAWSCLGALLCMALASTALAQEAAPAATTATQLSAALYWARLPGSEACVGGAELTKQLEAQLGHPVFGNPRDAKVAIEGHVEHSDGAYRAHLRMLSADGAELGKRELSSTQATCTELSETLVVVLALMIDPDGSAQTVAPPMVAPPVSAPAPVTPPVTELRYIERPARHRIVGFARLGLRMLNDPAYGFGGAYELLLGKAGLVRVEGIGYAERDHTFDQRGATVRLAYGGVAYCPVRLALWRAELATCAGAELGRLRSAGHDFIANRSKSIAWVSGSLAARATLPVKRFIVQLGASVVLPRSVTYRAKLAQGNTTNSFVLVDVDQPAFTLDLAIGARL